ncbi:MAG: Hsp70 family protein, partial [Myxococcales bacterium]|nr:Hsp70 family protein [Myxococcales bacterium]
DDSKPPIKLGRSPTGEGSPESHKHPSDSNIGQAADKFYETAHSPLISSPSDIEREDTNSIVKAKHEHISAQSLEEKGNIIGKELAYEVDVASAPNENPSSNPEIERLKSSPEQTAHCHLEKAAAEQVAYGSAEFLFGTGNSSAHDEDLSTGQNSHLGNHLLPTDNQPRLKDHRPNHKCSPPRDYVPAIEGSLSGSEVPSFILKTYKTYVLKTYIPAIEGSLSGSDVPSFALKIDVLKTKNLGRIETSKHSASHEKSKLKIELPPDDARATSPYHETFSATFPDDKDGDLINPIPLPTQSEVTSSAPEAENIIANSISLDQELEALEKALEVPSHLESELAALEDMLDRVPTINPSTKQQIADITMEKETLPPDISRSSVLRGIDWATHLASGPATDEQESSIGVEHSPPISSGESTASGPDPELDQFLGWLGPEGGRFSNNSHSDIPSTAKSRFPSSQNQQKSDDSDSIDPHLSNSAPGLMRDPSIGHRPSIAGMVPPFNHGELSNEATKSEIHNVSSLARLTQESSGDTSFDRANDEATLRQAVFIAQDAISEGNYQVTDLPRDEEPQTTWIDDPEEFPLDTDNEAISSSPRLNRDDDDNGESQAPTPRPRSQPQALPTAHALSVASIESSALSAHLPVRQSDQNKPLSTQPQRHLDNQEDELLPFQSNIHLRERNPTTNPLRSSGDSSSELSSTSRELVPATRLRLALYVTDDNIRLGYLKNGQIESLANNNHQLNPAWVAINHEGSLVFGEYAVRIATQYPERAAPIKSILHAISLEPRGPYSHELHIEEDDARNLLLLLDNQWIPISELFTLYFQRVYHIVSNEFFHGDIELILAIPAEMNERSMSTLRDAASDASFPAVRLVPIPLALLGAFGFGQGAVDIAVSIEIGLTFTTVTLVRRYPLELQIVDVQHTSRCSSALIRSHMVDAILAAFPPQSTKDSESLAEFRHQIFDALAQTDDAGRWAPEIKFRLTNPSTQISHRISVSLPQLHTYFREDVYAACEAIDQLLIRNSLLLKEIGHIAFGGSGGYFPPLRQALSQRLGIEPLMPIHSEMTILTGMMQDDRIMPASGPNPRHQTLSTPIGLELPGGRFRPILLAGAALPAHLVRQFPTARDRQTEVDFRFYQGDSDLIKKCTPLGNLRLGSLPKRPKGSLTVELNLSIDLHGIFRATLTEHSSGQTTRLESATVQTTPEHREVLQRRLVTSSPSIFIRVWRWLLDTN